MQLNNGEVPIFEPGLAAMVKKCEAASHLRFTTDVEAAVHHGEFQLIAAGSPSGEDGATDLNHVLAAARGNMDYPQIVGTALAADATPNKNPAKAGSV